MFMTSRGVCIARVHEGGMDRVLVLDADSDAGIEVIQSLGRAGAQIDACAPQHCLAFHSRYVSRRLRQPGIADPGEFNAWIRSLDQDAHYQLVVATTERALRALRRLPPTDAVRVRAILASDEAIDVALDKQRTWSLARSLAVPVPESVLIESLDALPPVPAYPVALKTTSSLIVGHGAPVAGAVMIADGPEARLSFLRTHLRYLPVQQQAYVAGHGVGVEFLYDRGRAAWHFAHERIHEGSLRGGASTYRRSIDAPPKVFAAARRLLDELSWHGVAMVEFKVRADGEFHLLEINPRLWGSLALPVKAGVDFPQGLLRLAKGECLGPQPQYRRNYYARDIKDDVFWQIANLRADHSDPLLLTRPRLVTAVENLRPLIGKESWDHFDWRDLSVTAESLRRVASRLVRLGKGALHRRRLAGRLKRAHRQRFGVHSERVSHVRKLLFVCHGNICRSAFAAELARVRLPNHQVESAGVAAEEGRQTPQEIAELARARGVELAGHRSARITDAQVQAAELILVSDLETLNTLLTTWPGATSRTTMLGLFAEPAVISIPDPYGAPQAEAGESLDLVVNAVNGLSMWLCQSRSHANSMRRSSGAALPP
jgi:protein-tyrosine-phosphatase/predicted ATP-grasp superfamily ATP-dependent carboligase